METAPCTEDTNQASGKFRFCSEIKQQHTMSLKEESLTESQTGQFSVLFSAGLTGPLLFGGTCANESKKDINLKSLKKGKW